MTKAGSGERLYRSGAEGAETAEKGIEKRALVRFSLPPFAYPVSRR